MTIHITYRRDNERDAECAHCAAGEITWCQLPPADHLEWDHPLCPRCLGIAVNDPADPDVHPRQSTVETPCVTCSQPVTTYPPEDGNGPAMCGRCAHSPTAVVLPDGATS